MPRDELTLAVIIALLAVALASVWVQLVRWGWL